MLRITVGYVVFPSNMLLVFRYVALKIYFLSRPEYSVGEI